MTDVTPMLLRLARTIHDEAMQHPFSGQSEPYPWTDCLIYGDDHSLTTMLDCKALARAVLKAMREPTDEMCAAGAAEMDYGYEYCAPKCWRAMVDAALGGGT